MTTKTSQTTSLRDCSLVSIISQSVTSLLEENIPKSFVALSFDCHISLMLSYWAKLNRGSIDSVVVCSAFHRWIAVSIVRRVRILNVVTQLKSLTKFFKQIQRILWVLVRIKVELLCALRVPQDNARIKCFSWLYDHHKPCLQKSV